MKRDKVTENVRRHMDEVDCRVESKTQKALHEKWNRGVVIGFVLAICLTIIIAQVAAE